jgi:probable rRNA maturation factor
VFRAEDVSPQCEVTLLVTDDPTIQGLNRQYLGRNRATDVIAFHQSEETTLPRYGERPPPEQPPVVLGDVVISLDTARRQAQEYGATLEQELALLAIHGMLHLLGHQDNTPARRRKMQQREREILGKLYPELGG